MRRAISVLGALLIVGIIVAAAVPGYADYTPRASVSAALAFMGKGREALASSCAEGTFGSKHTPADIGLPESDPSAYVYRAELVRVAPGAVRLRAALTDIHGRLFFGLFPLQAIPQGSILEYELTCSADKKFFSRFSASTVVPKYLPAGLRGL